MSADELMKLIRAYKTANDARNMIKQMTEDSPEAMSAWSSVEGGTCYSAVRMPLATAEKLGLDKPKNLKVTVIATALCSDGHYRVVSEMRHRKKVNTSQTPVSTSETQEE